MLIPVHTPNILNTPFHYSVLWEEDGPLVTPVPLSLTDATPRRQAAFTAGRFCATKAIERMDPSLSTHVGRQVDGSPLWPTGVVGSITHTEGFASAAVAYAEDCLGLGIDSEKMTDSETLQAAQRLVVREEERTLFNRLTLTDAQLILLSFSAKESIFKCLRPRLDRSFDYTAVSIDAVGPDHFHFHLTESLHHDFPKSFSAEGRYEFSHGYVHTAVELSRESSSHTS